MNQKQYLNADLKEVSEWVSHLVVWGQNILDGKKAIAQAVGSCVPIVFEKCHEYQGIRSERWWQ